MHRSLQIIVLFGVFIISCQSAKINENVIIGIQPFYHFEEKNIDIIVDSLKNEFHCKVYIYPNQSLPKRYITRIKSKRYRADSILNWLDKMKPDSVDIMLGLIDKEIAISKIDKVTHQIKKPQSIYKDWAIFGLGSVNGHSCVVSTKRLKTKNRIKFINRLVKVCSHEIGHVAGLRHCLTKSCVMNDANETIKTIDNSSGQFCDKCQSIIF